MMDARDADAERAFLHTPVGGQGTGATRYAAAMYFYTLNQMPANMLEIYRRCSNLDAEDPVNLAQFEGIDIPSICLVQSESQTP